MKKLFLSLSIFLLIGSVITSCTSDDIISDEYSAPTDISVNKQAGAREIGEKLLEVGSINSIFYFLHKAAEPFNCLEQDNLA